MSNVPRRSLVVGFAGGAALMLGLLWIVDVGRVAATLRRAEAGFLALMVGAALLWLVAWGLTLKVVLDAVGINLPVATSVSVHAAAVFANNVTPFAQAGGEPVTALLISKVVGGRYETGLAGIASFDVLNAVSSVALLLLGAAVYASSFTLGSGTYVALGSAVGAVAVVVAALALLWRHREAFVDRVAGTVAGVFDRLRWGPLGSVSTSEAGIADRMRGFFGSVERVATDRRRLVLAISLSAVGWVLQAAALVAAFAALGRSLPLVVALFVIPLSNLAGATPLPGGLGGVETALVGLLVPTTGIGAAVVTAAVLLFRVGVYWIPVALGGTSTTVYGVRVLS